MTKVGATGAALGAFGLTMSAASAIAALNEGDVAGAGMCSFDMLNPFPVSPLRLAVAHYLDPVLRAHSDAEFSAFVMNARLTSEVARQQFRNLSTDCPQTEARTTRLRRNLAADVAREARMWNESR